MIILKTILYVLLFIILAVLLIVFLLLIIPFKYTLKLYNENDELYGLDFNYIVVNLKGELRFKPKFLLKMTIFNKTIVDTSVKKEKKKKDSIEDTDFIKNKGLEKEISAGSKEIKKLFLSAKKSELRIKKENKEALTKKEKREKIKASNSIIDSFKKLLPSDLIYVIKRFVAEGICVLEKIKPNTCEIDFKYGEKDPYKKGLMLAVMSPLYAMMGDKLKINQNSKKGDYYKVTYTRRPVLITLLGPIIRLLLDSKVRKFIF
ncbi:MAG: hypothetical protein IKI71_00760 [Lachnospiraceae bacterium]|nr:hypothetical protein [Lachnospiraceae bacterium]